MGLETEGFYEQRETPSLWGAVHDMRRARGDMGDETNRSLDGLTLGLVGWCVLAFAVFVYGAVSGRLPQAESVVIPLVIVGLAVAHYVYMRRKVFGFFEHYVVSRLKEVFEDARRELARPFPRADDYTPSDWVRVHDRLKALEAEEIAMVERLNGLTGKYICWWMMKVGHKLDTSEAYSFMYSFAGTGGVLGNWYYTRTRALEEIAAVKTLAKVA